MKYLSRFKKETYVALFICFLFFIAYFTLSLVKHIHFQSGYDLSIANQIVWEFSRFMSPVVTVHAYAFMPVFWDHIEFVYMFISPFYWLVADSRMLLFLQVLAISLSGLPVFFLARKYNLNIWLSYSILFVYFTFFGMQNAIWSDVHSLVFAVSFLAFFIYFLDIGKKWLALIFFFLALTSKEDIGLLIFLISFVYLIRTKDKFSLYLMVLAALYVFILFFIYYPMFTLGYIYIDRSGLLSDINLLKFFNTPEKREVIYYSLSSFGFLPLLNPLTLIPFLGDLGHYFIFGNTTATSAQSIFMHYRISEALLLSWSLILTIGKYKRLNNKYIAFYLLMFTCLNTYLLHAPLTYLTKQWFWTEPSGVKNINQILKELPNDAYVVTQTNIAAHISNRKMIVTMWGDMRNFKSNSPCSKDRCEWFKWAGDPKYLVVDTSPEWNIINLLANRPDFIAGLKNMEKQGIISKYKQIGNSVIYNVNKKPN